MPLIKRLWRNQHASPWFPASVWVCILCFAVGIAVAISPPSAKAQAPGGNASESERKMTLDDVLRLLDRSVSSLDILVELKIRKLDKPINQNALQKLAAQGADRTLLNHVSEHYHALDKPLNDLLVFQAEERSQRLFELAEQLIDQSPRLLPAYFARARAHLQLKNAELAEKDIRQLLDYAPDSCLPQYLLALSYQLAGKDAEAMNSLTSVLQKHSSQGLSLRSECYLARGNLLAKAGKHRQAAEDYQRALAYPPQVWQQLDTAAELFARSGDPAVRSPAAAKELATALQLLALGDAPRIAAQIRLAEAAASAGDFKAAKAHLDLTNAFTIPQEVAARIAPLRAEVEAEKIKLWNPAPSGAGAVESEEGIAGIPHLLVKIAASDERGEFYLASRAVTRGQWAEAMGQPAPDDPGAPQDQISFTDAQAFIAKCNETLKSHGMQFRLPSSQECELAHLQQNAKKPETDQERISSPEEAIAEWTADRFAPKRADLAVTPFYVVRGRPSRIAVDESDESTTGFAPESARWRGLGLRLAADRVVKDAQSDGDRLGSRWGLARTIDLAARLPEWDSMTVAVHAKSSVAVLLLLETAIHAHGREFDKAQSSARRLVNEVDLVDPRRADFGRCLTVLLALRRPGAAPEEDKLKELADALDIIRARRDFAYWFAEYARAVLLRTRQNWEEAASSAQRALDLAPPEGKAPCRTLQALVERRDHATPIDLPMLSEMLSDRFLPTAPTN